MKISKGLNKVLFGLLILVFLVGVSAVGYAEAADKPVVVRFATIYPPKAPTGIASDYFAKLVKEKSKGEIDVQVFPSGQLGGEAQLVESVKIGAVEMSNPGTGICGRIQKEYLIFPLVYLFNDWDHLTKVTEGPIGQELAAKFLKSTGIRVLTSNWFREPRFLYGKRPVHKLEDLKGFRVRVPETAIWIAGWKRLGATPTPIALKELYTSLQQGVVDGCELTISYCYFNGIHRVAKNVMLSKHALESNLLIINNQFYEGLSPEHQKILKEAGVEAGKYHQELVQSGVDEVLKKMESEGATLVKIDRERWIKKADGLGAELEKYYGPGLYQKIRALATK